MVAVPVQAWVAEKFVKVGTAGGQYDSVGSKQVACNKMIDGFQKYEQKDPECSHSTVSNTTAV